MAHWMELGQAEAGLMERTQQDALLAVENLTFRFRGGATDVVADVSFGLKRGETLCIVGESGCGKSVTALALMGLLPAYAVEIHSGDVTFDHARFPVSDLGTISKLRGDRMAMIFQEPMTSLNPTFKIGEQIAESVRQHRHCSHLEARNRAEEMLNKVGIPAARRRLDEYPHQLSGGMRQRVMIAMALANDPAVLIADEPTTALDVTIQAQILNLIADLQRDGGMGTILITHDLGVVAEVATNVAVMYAGRIVEIGPAAEIFNNPQHPYTIGLMSSVPRLSGPRTRLTTVPGMVPTNANMPSGCRFAGRCPFTAPRCNHLPALTTLKQGHQVACHFAPLEEMLELSA